MILREDIEAAAQPGVEPSPAESEEWPTLATVERRYIDRVLEHTHGNKTRAAEVLGIDRRTLSRLFARERAERTDAPAGAFTR
jgi:DNA-binding NtrC family response regulator